MPAEHPLHPGSQPGSASLLLILLLLLLLSLHFLPCHLLTIHFSLPTPHNLSRHLGADSTLPPPSPFFLLTFRCPFLPVGSTLLSGSSLVRPQALFSAVCISALQTIIEVFVVIMSNHSSCIQIRPQKVIVPCNDNGRFEFANNSLVSGGRMYRTPENNPALSSNIFSPSTWRCEGWGGGSFFKLWGYMLACLPACLPGQIWSVYIFSPLILCMIINTSKPILASCPVCFGLRAQPFVSMFEWLIYWQLLKIK